MDFASACAPPTDKTSSDDAGQEDEPEYRHKILVKGPCKQRFEVVFSKGKRAKGDLARIIAVPGTGLIGIAVSKQVGSKPNRNRLKRRFREAISSPAMAIDSGLDYVVVVNTQANTAAFKRIEEEVKTLFASVAKRWAEESECS